jgi:adenylate cyclase
MLSAATIARNYRRMALYVNAAIVILVAMAYSLGLFVWSDALFYDLHFKVRGTRTPSGQIVLVYMDELSAARLERHQASWSRHNMAQAVRNLTTAGSEIIALDMIFSAPGQNTQQDIELANAISLSNNVVLARIAAVPGLGAVEPLAIFQQGMIGDGFIDLPLDRDGYLRKVRFLTATPLEDGTLQIIPAFALEIARTFRNIDYQFDFSHADFFTLGNSEQQQLKLPYPELLINYYGTDQMFTQLNYADVVMNKFDPAVVAGKIVLVGSRLKTEKDVFDTPFTRYTELQSDSGYQFAKNITSIHDTKEPGLACHAHAIETILNQEFILPLEHNKTFVLLLMLAVGGHPLFFRQRKTSLTFLCGTLMLASVLMLSQVAFQHGIWLKASAPLALIITQIFTSIALIKMHEKRRSDWVKAIFGKYVSESVVERLVRGQIDPNMEGQNQELTILFADLRSFTNISETLNAQQTTQLLNTFFAAMIPQIQQRQGTVDKLIGDAIMAIYGAPGAYADHAQQAAVSALNMQQALATLKSSKSLPGLEQLQLGIGLNSGEVTVGNLGCAEFMNYTVIGDNVNLASRIEGLNKIYGSSILLTQQTANQLNDSLCVRELDWVAVKGKNSTTTLFELIGFTDQINSAQHELLSIFAQGLNHYRQREWILAQQSFTQALTVIPDDGPSQLFLQRSIHLQTAPPSADWDGTTRFLRK